MVNHVVDALFGIQFSLDIVAVVGILHDELNILELALAVGEQLGQLNSVGKDMCVVDQGVVVCIGGTLPGQNHLVGVAGIAVNNGIIGVHGCGVGNADGAVGVARVDHGAAGINGLGSVDLRQAALGHFDGHGGFLGGGGIVGNVELAVSLSPGGDQIGAVCILKEFDDDIVLVVGQTGRQGVDEGITVQVSAFGSDSGQRGNDLVVDNIAVGSGTGMGVAVVDIVRGAVVLAGVVHILTQSLFQGGNAGGILGVNGNIVDPAGAAVSSVAAVNGGHGDADEERIAGAGDHFRNQGFHDQVQTQIQVGCFGFAIGIGQGHCGTVVGCNVGFQSILDGGGVGFQSSCQGVYQNIGLIEVLGLIQLVSIGIALCAIVQAQSLQQISALGLVDGVQNLNMFGGQAVSSGFCELDNVSNSQISKLDTCDGIAVAFAAVAQVGFVIGVACTDSFAQGLVDMLVIDTSADIAGVPDTVLLGVGDIILINGQGADFSLIDQRGINGFRRRCHAVCCVNTGNTGNGHHKCQTHGKNLLHGFHRLSGSFHNKIDNCYYVRTGNEKCQGRSLAW